MIVEHYSVRPGQLMRKVVTLEEALSQKNKKLFYLNTRCAPNSHSTHYKSPLARLPFYIAERSDYVVRTVIPYIR